MAKRYLVTQPSYINDTLLFSGDNIDAADDFAPSPHLVLQPLVPLPADALYFASPVNPSPPTPPAVAPKIVIAPKPKTVTPVKSGKQGN